MTKSRREFLGAAIGGLLFGGLVPRAASAQMTGQELTRLFKAANIVRADGLRFDPETYASGVVLINFWAYWCPNCIAEFASLIELQKRMGPDDLAVLLVSEQNNWAQDRKFAATHHIPFALARYDPYQMAREDYVRLARAMVDADGRISAPLPITYVISRTGRRIARYIGGQDWTNAEILRHMQAYAAD